jgi:hypothetical protein
MTVPAALRTGRRRGCRRGCRAGAAHSAEPASPEPVPAEARQSIGAGNTLEARMARRVHDGIAGVPAPAIDLLRQRRRCGLTRLCDRAQNR